MSHNSYTRTTWSSGTALLAGELADLDAKTFKAINGDEGGTWAPSSVITIGGSGVTLAMVGTNTLSFGFLNLESSDINIASGSFNTVGVTNFLPDSTSFLYSGATWTNRLGSITSYESGSYIGIAGIMETETTFYANLKGAWNWGSDSSINFGCKVYANNAIEITGDATVNGNSVINGTLVAGNTYLSGLNLTNSAIFKDIEVTEDSELSAVMVCTGTGRVRRPGSILTSSGSISPNTSTVYHAPSLSNNITVQIDDTSAGDGDEMFLSNRSSTYYVDVRNTSGSGGNSLITLQSGIHSYEWALIKRISGLWYVIGRGAAI